MQAPPTRDPLQPAAESALNSRSSTPSISKKRRRDENENSDVFTAKSIDAKTKTTTVTFAPVVLVSRSNIPLVWLAPASSYKTLSSPYLFEAHLLPTWQHEGCALVARLTPNGGLYAIEKASQQAWVGCRLSSWVTEEYCRAAADGQVKLLDQGTTTFSRKSHKRSDSQSTTASGGPLTPCSPKRPKNRRGALARMSILSSKDSQDQTQSVGEESPAIVESPQLTTSRFDDNLAILQGQIAALEPLPPSEEHAMDPSAALDVQENRLEPAVPSLEAQITEEPRHDHSSPDHAIHQYLDTLYLSRTSLAFYAKGPLSRASAQAKSVHGGLDLERLAETYRSLILPAKKSDLKYKDSLPGAVKALASTVAAEEGAKANKKRDPKKIKLGKDGLYNCETGIIEKWWHRREIRASTTAFVNAAEFELKAAVMDLRTRETQMQLLLILEVMALESMTHKGQETHAEPTDPSVKVEAGNEDVSKVLAHTPKVQKKSRNLQSELDAIVDKLSIWHTVSLDDMLSSPDKCRDGEETLAKSKDKLKEFCAEVIKPFYSVKLPEQTKSLCRKLGGAGISPQRPRPSSSKSSSRVKPSQSTKPRPRSATKHALERVLSEDKTSRHGSPPILSRSSTVPNLRQETHMLNLKREPSDISGRPMSRSSMQKSVSFVGREIDLIAEAKAHEVKKRKLDKINTQQKELKVAIEALKKPNRGNVARVIMDEAEQRRIIQITATPSRRRVAHLLKTGHKLVGLDGDEMPVEEVDPIIPSSTIKPVHVPSMNRSSTKKRAVLAALSDTPSRGLSRTSNPLQLSASSRAVGDTIAATPATNRLRPDLPLLPLETPVPKMRKSGRAVLFTPIKRTDVDVQDIFKDAPVIPEEAGKAMDRVMGGKGLGEQLNLDISTSIYDQLGWNDEHDGDL